MRLDFFLLFPATVLCSGLLTYGSKLFAQRFNLFIDKPNQRSLHSNVIPRCGGISIVIISICAISIFYGFGDRQIVGYLLGGLVVSLVGLFDDLIGLKGVIKIIGMVSASLIPVLFGLRLGYFNIAMNNQIILYILTLIWIYGMINAFNFMDGSDGLVGGAAAISSFFLMGFGFMSGNYFVALAALFLMSSCIGFLFFNYSPASIFLGDGGSMFLGYTLAVLSIITVNQSKNEISMYAFVLVFAVIIYDAMVVFVRRGLEGKNVLEAHREHLYQRLIILGYSHRDVSILYYMFCALFGIAAIFFCRVEFFSRIIILLAGLFILICFSFIVRRLEQKHVRK